MKKVGRIRRYFRFVRATWTGTPEVSVVSDLKSGATNGFFNRWDTTIMNWDFGKLKGGK